jgi:hypothetical protein
MTGVLVEKILPESTITEFSHSPRTLLTDAFAATHVGFEIVGGFALHFSNFTEKAVQLPYPQPDARCAAVELAHCEPSRASSTN